MTTFSHPVNPFYAAQVRGWLPTSTPPVYAKLPRAPRTASPVPHLTSLYHFSQAGEYGDRSYPGNCGGNLIKDLLRYFKPASVFDPMTGSGTCRDVCEELDIYCWSSDLHQNVDACDPTQFPASVSSSPGFIRPIGGRSSTRRTAATCPAPRRLPTFSSVISCLSTTAPALLFRAEG